MVKKKFSNNVQDDEIFEEATFGYSQFKDMIEWITNRKGFKLECQITGEWIASGEFFKGYGNVLKIFTGKIDKNILYVILREGYIGKNEILIGRRIIEINRKKFIQTFQYLKDVVDDYLKDVGDDFKAKFFDKLQEIQKVSKTINPNVFVFRNFFKKDLQNQIFFRNIEYDRALSWLKSFTKKYEISAYVEGILIGNDRQINCIITGTVSSVDEKDIYIKLLDAFNPLDPLNDDTKEWLAENWTIQISQTGINKIHPKYLLFEIGEELSLAKNILNVENLSVTLDGRKIIENVNFNLMKGEILGIIGESGSGKSTTIKAILGEFSYKGEINVFGIDAHKKKEIAPFIGYVPQDLSRIYGNFNCLENIVAFGRNYEIQDDILIQRGKKILKDLDMEEIANQPVSTLSGGQKRRASIAIAMVHNPYLLFLDEPTSGLDPLARYELWDYLDLINREYGITLVVISHYLDEIEYCDKSCIFLRGIGFFDYNTPEGLKKSIPGKGIALEITLNNVNIESVEILRKIKGVKFVIQRGERIRILSLLSSEILAQRVIKTLEKENIGIHSISYKVSIDMVDYFTYISVLHQQKGVGGLDHLSKSEMLAKMQEQTQELDLGISFLENSKEAIQTTVDMKKKVIDLSKDKKNQNKL